MYADDILLYASSPCIETSKAIVADACQRVSDWLQKFGLEISIPKTQFIVFSRSNKIKQQNLSIDLADQTIYGLKSIKYLGVYLDQKLLWNQHINYITQRISRANSVIRTIARVFWGPSPTSLLVICKGLTEALSNWGMSLTWRASPTRLAGLDRVFLFPLE